MSCPTVSDGGLSFPLAATEGVLEGVTTVGVTTVGLGWGGHVHKLDLTVHGGSAPQSRRECRPKALAVPVNPGEGEWSATDWRAPLVGGATSSGRHWLGAWLVGGITG